MTFSSPKKSINVLTSPTLLFPNLKSLPITSFLVFKLSFNKIQKSSALMLFTESKSKNIIFFGFNFSNISVRWF